MGGELYSYLYFLIASWIKIARCTSLNFVAGKTPILMPILLLSIVLI